jgi:cell division protease FtsH
VTQIARQMVGRWGMSEAVGPISVLPPPGQEAAAASALSLLAGETRELFDAEVRRFIDEGYEEALRLLREHRDKLDALVAALLEHESLDEAEAYRIAGVERMRATPPPERQPEPEPQPEPA